MGFTNRSRPTTAVARPGGGAEGVFLPPRPNTSSGQYEVPRASGSSQRPLNESTHAQDVQRPDHGAIYNAAQSDLFKDLSATDNVFSGHHNDSGYSAYMRRKGYDSIFDGTRTRATTFGSKDTRPNTDGKSMSKRVRDKIMRAHLNIGPALREHSGGTRLISADDLRQALSSFPQLDLHSDELDFCVGSRDGPDNKIDVREFLDYLKIPSYEENYDPWGKSRSREHSFLRNRSSKPPSRQFNHQSFDVPKKAVYIVKQVDEKKSEKPEDGSANVSPGAPNKPKLKAGSGLARKYLKQMSEVMHEKGVTLLDAFRAIDADSSGAIDQKEFQQAVELIGVPGMGEKQLAFLFQNIDENGNGKVDIHELMMALSDATIRDNGSPPASQPSRPSTFREDVKVTAANSEPWAKRSKGERVGPVLPSDHFNLRFRRALVPPYATSETVLSLFSSMLRVSFL